MFKNKLVVIMLAILCTISVMGITAVVVVKKMQAVEGKTVPTIDEILESSVDVPEITTNLIDGSYIKIAMKIQTNNKDGKTELTKRDFQIKNIIIQELSQLKREQLHGKDSMLKLETVIKSRINEVMQDGKVEKVYITSIILQ